MRKRSSSIAALAAILGAASASLVAGNATAAVQAASPHHFATWNATQARDSSPFAGTANPFSQSRIPTPAATAFSYRVETQLQEVKRELGSAFVAAAIDSTGARLVIRITGSASSLTSSALASLDSGGGEVRIVPDQLPAAMLASELATAEALVGSSVGDARVLSVARDDLGGQVVVGVDRDVDGAAAVLLPSLPDVHVVLTTPAAPVDGDTFGNNPNRASVPVAGGESIIAGSGAGCSTALTGTRAGGP